jgi:hypothetical protein
VGCVRAARARRSILTPRDLATQQMPSRGGLTFSATRPDSGCSYVRFEERRNSQRQRNRMQEHRAQSAPRL